MSIALRKLHTISAPAARLHVRRLSGGGPPAGPAFAGRCRCWPNPPCHHHQAGNCGYSQFECGGAGGGAPAKAATLPGVVGQGGAPVTVSHHPAAQQLQQAMQQGAQSFVGSLSQAGQQVAAAMRMHAHGHGGHRHSHQEQLQHHQLMQPELSLR